MPLNLRNDFLQIKEADYDAAIAAYDMTDRMVQDSMESIRQWYKMQPYLPEGAVSDDRLFRHLLAVGFSMEKAKEKIDNMLTAYSLIPELLQDRDPTAAWFKTAQEYVHCGVIPQRLDDMSRVSVCTYTSKDPSDMDIWEIFKAGLMMLDYRLSADISVGEHYVIDLKEVKLGHVAKLTPTLIKKFMFIIQGCFGAKCKGIHYVNVPQHAELVVSIIKAGLSKKIGSRLVIYKDYESLHKVIPKSHLPSDFGGDNKSIRDLAGDFQSELCKQEWRDWFKNQDRMRTDESKRVGATSDMSNQLLGMHGSFRSLELD